MKILINAIIGGVVGFVIGYFLNIFFWHALGFVPEAMPSLLLSMLGTIAGFLFAAKDKKLWIYHCPKCNKLIGDDDVWLPIWGSLLHTWNPKNYYVDYLHFHCSKCKAHIGFNWSKPTLKIIAYQFVYVLLVLLMYKNSSLKDSYDTDPIYGVLSVGIVAIFVICYIVYSKNAKLEIIVDDIEARKKAESLEAKKITSAKEDFGENEAVLYELGNPDLDDMIEGVIEIKDGDLLFKEQYKDKTYFIIPLKQISEIKTEGNLLSSSIYNGMASMGAERNHLYVKFQKDGREHTAMFANTSHNITSTICERLKHKILNAKHK